MQERGSRLTPAIIVSSGFSGEYAGINLKQATTASLPVRTYEAFINISPSHSNCEHKNKYSSQ